MAEAYEEHRDGVADAEACALEVRAATYDCVVAAECDPEVTYECLRAQPDELGRCPAIDAEVGDAYTEATSACLDF